MTFLRQQRGRAGEDLAEEYLKNKGFKILGRNLRFPFGEIDILAEDGGEVVIVEVKAKTTERYGAPAEEVDYFKKQKLHRLARLISQRYPHHHIRIDVLSVKLEEKPSIEHFKNALEF